MLSVLFHTNSHLQTPILTSTHSRLPCDVHRFHRCEISTYAHMYSYRLFSQNSHNSSLCEFWKCSFSSWSMLIGLQEILRCVAAEFTQLGPNSRGFPFQAQHNAIWNAFLLITAVKSGFILSRCNLPVSSF